MPAAAVKLKRIKPERGNAKTGWTRWVQPVMRGYLLACCDCGLVHRMDFRTNGEVVQFRAQRARNYTARQRRLRRIKVRRAE
jgi:hypothetical protein